MSRHDLAPDDLAGLLHTAHQRQLMQAWQRAQRPTQRPRVAWGPICAAAAALAALGTAGLIAMRPLT